MNLNNINIFKLKRALLVVLVVPVIFVLISADTRNMQGEYYQTSYSDPSYAYLLNSLNIANGERPGHTDHPGTTVQLLGGMYLKISSLIGKIRGDEESITTKVLQDPEYYIVRISNVLISIVAVAVFLFGLQVYLVTKNLALVMIAQIFPLAFSSLIEHLPRLEPEPLLVASSFLLATIFVPLVVSTEEDKFRSRRTASLAGIVMGVGVVTKVTFVPLLLLLFVFRGKNTKLVAFTSLAATMIILTIPIWRDYPRIFIWLSNVLIHSGNHGSGDIGLPSVSRLLKYGYSLWAKAPVMFYFVPVLITALFFSRKNKNISGLNRTIFLLLLVLITQILITIKYPNVHYLMPSMALSGLLVLVAVLAFPRLGAGFIHLPVLVLSIYLVYVSFWQVDSTFRSYQKTHNQLSQLKQVAETKNCRIVDYYRSSSVQYALSFGNDFSRQNYSKELAELYPSYISYHLWGKYFSGYNKKLTEVEASRLLLAPNPVCLLGTQSLPYKGQPKVKVLENKGRFTLYQFTGWNENVE